MLDHSCPQSAAELNPYQLHRVLTPKKETFTCLSHAWHGVHSHYVGPQSVVCAGQTCKLDHATVGLPRWRGYIFARFETHESRPIVLLEFTERCYVGFRDRLRDHESLRGHQLTMWRAKKTKTSPLCMGWLPATLNPKYLPEVPDMLKKLERMYTVGSELLVYGDPLREARKDFGSMREELASRMKEKD